MTRDWDRHYRGRTAADARAASVLCDNAHLLPTRGRALDLACGLGGNALMLARSGLETLAWDRARSAIEALAAQARSEHLPLTAEVRDVVEAPPEPARFDVIVVSHFLERSLAPALIAALRPSGLLFYQTFTRSRVNDRGPGDDRFRLADGELLALFAALRVVFYRDEGRIGGLTQGLRDEAQLVACRIPHT